jgi:pyruvate kinase
MNSKSLPEKKTKIVCTIGPACESPEILGQLIDSGMNIARLNFAHGSFKSHRQVIKNIRTASKKSGRRVAIMGDLPGPKMRVGHIDPDPLLLDRGQAFTLQTGDFIGDAHRASMQFAGLAAAVKAGDKIFINDGYIQLKVQEVVAQEVRCLILVGGELRSHKGVNFPGIDLGVSAFTAYDRKCLAFAAEQGLDAISQSFVQNGEDLTAVRQAAADLDYAPFLIAKIERAGARDNIKNILDASDGLMVARGDLGVEIPIEGIAITQKEIITQANLVGKPVITATQMLESMVAYPRPTRAESTDVANAILDGTDCVMLSGETAVGNYPVEAVAVMARIAQATEPHCLSSEVVKKMEYNRHDADLDVNRVISLVIDFSTKICQPAAVVAPTISGRTARLISRFRLPMWVVAVSPSEATCQSLQFSYGVYAVHEKSRPSNWEQYSRDWLAAYGLNGEMALLTQGSGTGQTGSTNKIGFIELSKPKGDDVVW